MRNDGIRLVRATVVFAAIFSILFPVCPLAQEDGDPVSIGTYRILHSRVLDEDRTVLVNLPTGYDETTMNYPVLYVLYGGQVRGYFAEAVHIVNRLSEASIIPQLIIVGVKNVARYRDNLPVNRNGEKGGAENFLNHFTNELIPFIGKSYRTNDFRILLGPQAGASFALYALMEQPGFFNVNIVTNPFWNSSSREYLLEKASDFFRGETASKNFLFITCNTGADNEATMENLARFTTIVEQGQKTNIDVIVNPADEKEKDTNIPPPGLKEGLKLYFKDYKFPDNTEIDGLDDLVRHYQNRSQDYGYEIDIPEWTLISQGDQLKRRGKIEAAKTLFEYAMDHYPEHANSYFQLAELHRTQRTYDQSLKYYEQFLERRAEPFIENRLGTLRKYINESAAYAVENAILTSGIDGGIRKYQEIRADDQSRLYINENEFNSLGYFFMTNNDIDAAIEVFKMNVELNPQSSNAYDNLGEAYTASGNKTLAIENFKKSLELNPGNTNAKERLEMLE